MTMSTALPTVPIRVAIRVRPMLPWEASEKEQSCCVAVVGSDQLVLGRDRQFRFDHVFNSTVSQVEVYETCLLPSVTACLDGYNTTVLAYGQTSSGKSYTMGSEGVIGGGWVEEEGEERAGIIPRTLKDLFQGIENRRSTEAGEAIQWQVGVSYIEIYKEELRDLLDYGINTQHLVIRDNKQGHTVVVGAREERVTSCDEALDLLFAGNTSRVTAATEMNKRSSRSHAIFTVFVESRWASERQEQNTELYPPLDNYTCGKCHFVDLAGSERASKTGNRGDRFKESVHINSGLLALGNVISALGDPKRISSHVPYRDSKITRFLKDSLGGNSHTIMIACLNPLAENFAESLNTLKFAKRARNIRNHPVINRDPQTARLHAMEGEIRSLKAELLRVQSVHVPLTPSTTASSGFPPPPPPPPCVGQNVTYTVTQLRRELELCQSNLETDEVLYTEKIEELNDAQSRHEGAVKELERVRGLWEAGEKTKVMLYGEIERLERRVRELETEKEQHERVNKPEDVVEAETEEWRNDVSVEERQYRPTDCHKEIAELLPSLQLIQGKIRTDREEDLSDEAILKSMRSLTALLAQHQQQAMSTNGSQEREVPPETSLCEPALSCSGHFLPGGAQGEGEGEEGEGERELHLLNQSAVLSAQQLSETQHKLVDVHNELRDLSIKIKLKEEWIRELAKNNIRTKQLNQTYITQIQSLEQEAAMVQQELQKAQTSLQRQQKRQLESSSAQELIQHQQQKLAETEKKLAAVQKKHRTTQKVLHWGERSARRVEELEAGLERLRSRQEAMRRRLKRHAETKTKLENDVQMYQQKVQQLQSHSECQTKVLRVKTQEAAVAQRKLRKMSSQSARDTAPSVGTVSREEQWLGEEVERVLQQKQALQTLEKELAERERLVREREMVVVQQAALETKQLHCSQAVARDLTRLSIQIQSLDSSIRASENQTKEQVTEDSSRQNKGDTCSLIKKLIKERDRLIEKRSELEERAHNTSLLPADEEKQLVQFTEHIEVLEAAIEFKNDTIQAVSREFPASQMATSNENVLSEMWQKLQQMSAAQVNPLLVSYVGKVVELRVKGQRREREEAKLAAESAERQQMILNLQRSLKQAQLEMERRLLSQEKEHQHQLQVLVQQLATPDPLPCTPTTPFASATSQHDVKEVESLRSRVKRLERDLYYYKKTSRDLKRLGLVKYNPTTSHSGSTCGDSSHKGEHPSSSTPNEGSTHELTEDSACDKKQLTEDSTCDKEQVKGDGGGGGGGGEEIVRSEPTTSNMTIGAQVAPSIGTDDPAPQEREGEMRGRTDSRTSSESRQPAATVPLVTRAQQQTNNPSSNKLYGETNAESEGPILSDSLEQGLVGVVGRVPQCHTVITKPKKQLRQLSASEIAERLSQHKMNSTPTTEP